MAGYPSTPLLLRVLQGEGLDARSTPHGCVGTVLESESTEVVWVAKQDETIDLCWSSQNETHVVCVLQGQLRVEFAARADPGMTLGPGDVLVLPPGEACAAYRWPTDAEGPTVFLAVTARPPQRKHLGRARRAARQPRPAPTR
jgi:quercetin dioxygenase-like cupin family protein